jgi:hypothetical protein
LFLIWARKYFEGVEPQMKTKHFIRLMRSQSCLQFADLASWRTKNNQSPPEELKVNSKIKPALGVAFLFLAIWTVNCSQNRGSPVEDSSEHTAQNQNQLEAEQDSIIRGHELTGG